MPELDFKGKEFVRNHHLTVPFHPLHPDAEKSVGEPDLDGNLIIHGDNLVALKALLPRYAGKVDCIFIDPPYNTGNEGWSYNDNVNSPVLKKWFDENPVSIEDGLRHDKWCAMMWPRLKLLWELLAETGSIWITLDDNEVHRARLMLDEIFGEEFFVASCIWHKVFSPKNTARQFSVDHDYVLVYAKNGQNWLPQLLPRTEEMDGRFNNPDADPRGVWTSGDLTARNPYSRGRYEVISPTGRTFTSGNRYWRQSHEEFLRLESEGRVWWGPDGNAMPRLKRFLSEVRGGVVPQTIWSYGDVGHTQDAKKQVLEVMQFGEEDDVFLTPKPTKLVERVITLCAPEIILDSFAGSGTTAHAVLQANARDGGNRKFILVECEDYADTLTAERVRRVIQGYPFRGTQRETLYEKKLNWTELKRGDALKEEVEAKKLFYQDQYDRVQIKVDDGTLKLIGERDIDETAPGLGGTFTYCTLGPALRLEETIIDGELPTRDALGEWLLYIANETEPRQPAPTIPGELQDLYLGTFGTTHYWFLYRPDRAYLEGPESALTLSLAEKIHSVAPNARHRVFSPVKYVSEKLLRSRQMHIEHAAIPFSLLVRGGG